MPTLHDTLYLLFTIRRIDTFSTSTIPSSNVSHLNAKAWDYAMDLGLQVRQTLV